MARLSQLVDLQRKLRVLPTLITIVSAMATVVNPSGDLVTVAELYAAMYWGQCVPVCLHSGLSKSRTLIPFLRRNRLRRVYIVRTIVHQTLVRHAQALWWPALSESRLFKVISTS